jgi:hypothetical protein
MLVLHGQTTQQCTFVTWRCYHHNALAQQVSLDRVPHPLQWAICEGDGIVRKNT